eukprot:CAMPEP_0173112456 /NCGR_PEP_ID=MMETSP1102-20130122/46046_1 /TAXON_ID=49646 /ORGANISM="Geminigera sp., Strain Caron Lab Isolate" /LENGTH=175 /DNA_ID=CAMNT_0014013565 /DNA_START=256 /DNA_END=780 /DNA_ORIENTATION=-
MHAPSPAPPLATTTYHPATVAATPVGDSLGASAYARKGGADDGGGGWVHGDSKTHAVTDGVPPIMSRHASALTLERSASGYSRSSQESSALDAYDMRSYSRLFSNLVQQAAHIDSAAHTDITGTQAARIDSISETPSCISRLPAAYRYHHTYYHFHTDYHLHTYSKRVNLRGGTG